ncbi:MAG: tRNA pseudouridine synthase [Anaerocolumna sp.]|jgi:tRNA pseudouridine38-40 synthase|nr:tRNA pseudouridine synthase [Anaerocolumna sp.]
MRNIKILLMYDGNSYSGWQRLGLSEKNNSIQGILEETISSYLGEEIHITGSGRTDAGVHALGQVANFKSNTKIKLSALMEDINRKLPEDIRILKIEYVDNDFHSRYSAVSKTYEYRIDTGERQSVFSRKYTYHVPETLNIENMKKAAEYLIGTHDFKAFSTDRKDLKSTVRTIYDINIYKPLIKDNCHNQNELRIQVTGNGFLYNMVRIITGTLISVGEGKMPANDIELILKNKKREMAGITLNPQGLFLIKVRY